MRVQPQGVVDKGTALAACYCHKDSEKVESLAPSLRHHSYRKDRLTPQRVHHFQIRRRKRARVCH